VLRQAASSAGWLQVYDKKDSGLLDLADLVKLLRGLLLSQLNEQNDRKVMSSLYLLDRQGKGQVALVDLLECIRQVQYRQSSRGMVLHN
jgi:Ca2+-binding EF-hand superfamily protein